MDDIPERELLWYIGSAMRSGVAAVCVGLALGCSTTSSIRRINGPEVEGDIVGGSPESIFVDTDTGRESEIRRDDVSSIDYPGNVHANVGAAVLVYGGLNILVGLPKCEERTDDKTAFCTGVFMPAALGAGLIVWGLIVQHGQKAGTADMSRRSNVRPPVQSRPAR